MNRRQLLQAAMAGTVSLMIPRLALAGVLPEQRRRLLDEAWDRAVANERALLVLLFSKEDEYIRGDRMGIWLNNGTNTDLAPLSQVELVCAQLEDLAEKLPGVEEAAGAWMILVHVGQSTPTWRSIVVPEVPSEAKIQDFDDFTHAFVGARQQQPKWERVRRAYGRHVDAVNRIRLDAELTAFRASIGRVLHSEGLTQSAAPLAQQARERWVQRAPPGAHWGRRTGCGYDIEPNPQDPVRDTQMITFCGLGHVEPFAERFLAFWPVA